MHLVEVLEGRSHLRHHGSRVGEVHAADVVALERVYEALGHAIALRAAHRRVDRLQAQLSSDLPGLGRDVRASVVREELQGMSLGDAIDIAEALLHGFDEHLSHRLARQPLAFPSPEGKDLAVAAVLCEGCRHGLARVALDLEAVRTPAHIAVRDCHFPLVRPAGLAPPRRLRQQQRMARHHAVDALGIDPRCTGGDSMPVHQCAGASIAIGRQLGDLRLDLVEQRGVADVRRYLCAGVDPALWAGPQAINI